MIDLQDAEKLSAAVLGMAERDDRCETCMNERLEFLNRTFPEYVWRNEPIERNGWWEPVIRVWYSDHHPGFRRATYDGTIREEVSS